MKLGHIGIPVRDRAVSKRFWDAIVPMIGLDFINETDTSVRWGTNGSVKLYVHTRAAPVTNVHVCFQVDTHEAVDACYEQALTHGGTDHGAPGIRTSYSPTYYAAFVLDPDGNNIEVVCRS
ncbi:VOC family protein [Patescibacteria group bacterium]|jgi:catechol 2,3-dioxygenase-like lactoylglutathione lyase family enzyme|nr:VOC family protein [Patescibacteria group bacterium]